MHVDDSLHDLRCATDSNDIKIWDWLRQRSGCAKTRNDTLCQKGSGIEQAERAVSNHQLNSQQPITIK